MKDNGSPVKNDVNWASFFLVVCVYSNLIKLDVEYYSVWLFYLSTLIRFLFFFIERVWMGKVILYYYYHYYYCIYLFFFPSKNGIPASLFLIGTVIIGFHIEECFGILRKLINLKAGQFCNFFVIFHLLVWY